MRRKDREVTDPSFFDYVLAKADILYLAMLCGGEPYCLPLNFARSGNAIYIHSAKEGQKLDCLRENGAVAFSMAVDVQVDPEAFTTWYKSVCGRGKVSMVEDFEEKRHALDLLAGRYNAKCPVPAPDANVNRVTILRIDIEEMSGKHCRPHPQVDK